MQNTRTVWLVKFRPEYQADWMRKTYWQQLPLLPLGPEATREMLTDLLGPGFVSAYCFAVVHVGLGQVDEAFDWLAKAEAQRSFYIGWLKVDPDLDPLRSDPRFAALLKQVGLDK